MTQYFVAMNGIKVPKVLEATAEKKLTKMSGNFNAKIIDRDNSLYNTATSGDEFEIIKNNIESETEVQSSYTDSVATNWYKFNDSLADSAGATVPVIKVRATAYYPFNGNANDESTSGNNGTVYGPTLTTDRFGVANKAYSFTRDVTSMYIEVDGLTNTLFNQTGTYSVSLWFKANSLDTGHNSIWNFQDGNSNRISLVFNNNGSLSFNRYNGSSYTAKNGPGITAGVWHHVVSVSNGGVLNLYLDGVELTGTTNGYAAGATVNKLRIGYMTTTNDSTSLDGSIDEVIILPVALTPTEVAALYELQSRHDWNDVFVDGKFGKAAELGGVGGFGPWVSLTPTRAVDGDCTFSLWVKPKQMLSRFAGRLHGSNASSRSGSFSGNWMSERYFNWYIRQADGTSIFAIDSDIYSLDEWYHIVGTAGNGKVNLYVNGILKSSKDFDGTYTALSTSPTTIGISNDSANYVSHCEIDDVRIYDTVLTEYQIKDIMLNKVEQKVFGGLIENVSRDEKRNYLLTVKGGDYTTKLNQVTVNVQAYDDREYSVIVRDLMHTYIMKSKVIDDFEAITGWTAAGDLGSLTLQNGIDADGHKYARMGNGAAQVLANYSSGTGTLTRTMSVTKNFLSTDAVTLYLYVGDVSKLGTNYSLKLGQDSSNYYTITKPKTTLVTGWNYVEFVLSEGVATGSPTLTSIDYYQLSFDVASGASNVQLMFDDMRKTPYSTADYKVSNVDFTSYYTTILFKNVTVHEAIKKIANIKPTKYDFFIDIYKVLDFSIMGTQSSGVTLQKGVNILTSNFIDDDTNLCNSVTVYGGRQQYTYEETFNGDGSNLEFTVTYEPVDAYVTVSGTKKLGYQEGMASSDFDYKIEQKNKKIIFQTGKAPGVGTNNIVIRYTYSVPLIAKKEDSTSIDNYKIRSKKIENPQLLTLEDVQTVASDYIDKWKDPIVNGTVLGKMEPLVDVGETITYIDPRTFETAQTFIVAGIKQNFIGTRLNTQYTLTSYQSDLEQYLNDLFDRLNALEEKEKGQSEVVSQLIGFAENLLVLDDPEHNLAVKFKNIAGDILIWGSTDYGIWGTFKWGSDASTSFIIGLSKLGVNRLGNVSSDWGANEVTNPSD